MQILPGKNVKQIEAARKAIKKAAPAIDNFILIAEVRGDQECIIYYDFDGHNGASGPSAYAMLELAPPIIREGIWNPDDPIPYACPGCGLDLVNGEDADDDEDDEESEA